MNNRNLHSALGYFTCMYCPKWVVHSNQIKLPKASSVDFIISQMFRPFKYNIYEQKLFRGKEKTKEGKLMAAALLSVPLVLDSRLPNRVLRITTYKRMLIKFFLTECDFGRYQTSFTVVDRIDKIYLATTKLSLRSPLSGFEVHYLSTIDLLSLVAHSHLEFFGYHDYTISKSVVLLAIWLTLNNAI